MAAERDISEGGNSKAMEKLSSSNFSTNPSLPKAVESIATPADPLVNPAPLVVAVQSATTSPGPNAHLESAVAATIAQSARPARPVSSPATNLVPSVRVGPDGTYRKNWAKGYRSDFLLTYVEGYRRAKNQGRDEERRFWRATCTEYNRLVPWNSDGNLELPYPISATDATAIDSVADLSPSEHVVRIIILVKRNAAIRRWLKTRVKSLNSNIAVSSSVITPGESISQSSSRITQEQGSTVDWAEIQGITKPKKALQAVQMFQHVERERVHAAALKRYDQDMEKALKEGVGAPKFGVHYSNKVAREMFTHFSEEEKMQWKKRAVDEKQERIEKFESDLANGPQGVEALRVIQENLGRTLGPIVQKAGTLAAMHSVTFFVGPRVKDNGEIGTIALAYGLTPGPPAAQESIHEVIDPAVWKAFIEELTKYGDRAFSLEEREKANSNGSNFSSKSSPSKATAPSVPPPPSKPTSAPPSAPSLSNQSDSTLSIPNPVTPITPLVSNQPNPASLSSFHPAIPVSSSLSKQTEFSNSIDTATDPNWDSPDLYSMSDDDGRTSRKRSRSNSSLNSDEEPRNKQLQLERNVQGTQSDVEMLELEVQNELVRNPENEMAVDQNVLGQNVAMGESVRTGSDSLTVDVVPALQQIACPPGSARWFQNSWKDILSSGPLTPKFETMMIAWNDWECLHAYDNDVTGFLPGKGRPSEMVSWMKRKSDPMVITDYVGFGQQLQTWWWENQPQSRRDCTRWFQLDLEDDDAFEEMLGDENDVWHPLQVTGKAGIYTVIAALAWWGAGIRDQVDEKAAWERMVVDVTYVLRIITRIGGAV
ncbi:hypothetical protein DL96DRAFT_1720313 [Flagelloscypha sp. PMI_526]|nr:hypothetical protein DL96DRAFT_1720313 [Flagelloscypha sp. PMI_526]